MELTYNIGKDKLHEILRTIYTDIVSLPNPLELGITVRIYNWYNATLYFILTMAGSGWTFASSPYTVGAIGAGGSLTIPYDEAGTFATPAGETTELLTFTLTAYTDAGYSNLYATYVKTVTIVMLKSDDGSWTVDDTDDFEGGTYEDWVTVNDGGQWDGVAMSLEHSPVLSGTHCMRVFMMDNGFWGDLCGGAGKTWTTPAARDECYVIINVRFRSHPTWPIGSFDNIIIRVNGVRTLFVGRIYPTAGINIPQNRYMRFVVPVPYDSTPLVEVVGQCSSGGTRACDFFFDYCQLISR